MKKMNTEIIKEKLNKMASDNIDNLANNETVKLSQILDKYILIEQKNLMKKTKKTYNLKGKEI